MVEQIVPIDFQWPTLDPFLFCVHHFDQYPAGNEQLGLDKKHFVGRNMGSDFTVKDGFRIYHGEEIPGFPVHPHRGFETITIVRQGYADHADSLGAAGRYGEGDVQWMTAGSGVQHSEMFPLLHKDRKNTVELFQIWINLPKKNKMVPPDFKMLWANKIPKFNKDGVQVTLISGSYQGTNYYEAPSNSYAKDPKNSVNILLVKMTKNSRFEFPKAAVDTNRMLYFFSSGDVQIKNQNISGKHAVLVDSKSDLNLTAIDDEIEFLILEAAPLREPVFQHGPFVMNTREEIMQAFSDYQKTEFGGWSWPRHDMIHGPTIRRFAKYPDGHEELPE